jgi:hypothetical protein
MQFYEPESQDFPGLSEEIVEEELVIDLLIAEQIQSPLGQVHMFVNDLADPLQHEFIQTFVLLSNGDGQVEDNRVFQGLFFNLNVQLITFCEHPQQIPCILSWEKNVLKLLLFILFHYISDYLLVYLFSLY